MTVSLLHRLPRDPSKRAEWLELLQLKKKSIQTLVNLVWKIFLQLASALKKLLLESLRSLLSLCFPWNLYCMLVPVYIPRRKKRRPATCTNCCSTCMRKMIGKLKFLPEKYPELTDRSHTQSYNYTCMYMYIWLASYRQNCRFVATAIFFFSDRVCNYNYASRRSRTRVIVKQRRYDMVDLFSIGL